MGKTMKRKKVKTPGKRRMGRQELADRILALQVSSQAQESPRDVELKAVLHELEVSQIELEVQNRELIESRSAAEESHEKYMNLYDFAPVGYLTLDRHGIIKEINLTAAEMLGAERNRLLHRPLSTKIREPGLLKFRTHLRTGREEDEQITTMIEILGKNDQVFPAQLVSTCFRDRKSGELLFRTALSDLTESKRAEKERDRLMSTVEAARRELLDFFIWAPMPMAIVLGPERLFTLANTPFIKLMGQPVLGKYADTVFKAVHRQSLIEIIDRVYKTGEPYSAEELRFVVPRGEEKCECFLNVTYTAVRHDEGQIKGVLLFEQDVTAQVLARKRLQAEKEWELKKQEELKKAKLGAEQASEIKSAFLANMSHEIRTPLGAILGFTDLLKDSSSVQEKAQYAEIIDRNGKALTKLIDDLLDLSKVEAGRLALEKISFDLQEVVSEVVALFKDSLAAKSVKIVASFAAGMPKIIESDPGRIRQILINLVGNAAKFTSEGSIAIHIDAIESQGKLKGVEFVVTDTGIGMSKDQAANLFEPFSQGDNSMTRRYGGSGLGLVLSRRLARALGGDVKIADCALGKGCSFIATIDATASQKESVSLNKTPVAAPDTLKPMQNVRVLLVEDSVDNQVLIRRILSKEGIKVEVANNGAEGVKMAASMQYDVVLMDMQMPVLDGYAATQQLREDGYAKPIVALTAHAMVEERNRILALGCDAHLTKPLNAKLLIETISGVLLPARPGLH